MEWSLNVIWHNLDGPDLTITFLHDIFHIGYDELLKSPWWLLKSVSVASAEGLSE